MSECGGCHCVEIEIEEISSTEGKLGEEDKIEPKLVDAAGVD